MQYPKSGVTGSDVWPGSADNLLGATITTGRVLWLRSAWFCNDGLSGQGNLSGAETKIVLSDCLVDSIGSGDLVQAYEIDVLSGATTHVQFKAPGMKFTAGCVITSRSGYICRGICGGGGYEE